MTVSRINIWKIGEGEGVELALEHEAAHSLTDGEELMAASTIIDLVDELDNGEKLVITREIW